MPGQGRIPGLSAAPGVPDAAANPRRNARTTCRPGLWLVEYYNDSLDYDRAVQEYVEALGGRIQEFREAHGNDHEGGLSSGCVASARAAVERSKRYPEFRQGVRAAMPALMSYQTDSAYQSALHRYMACFQESTGLTLQGPSVEGAQVVQLRLRELRGGGASDDALRAEELRLAALDLQCFEQHLEGELRASGYRTLAKAGLVPKGSEAAP